MLIKDSDSKEILINNSKKLKINSLKKNIIPS